MRVLGLDPGLRRTGWGIIETEGPRLRHVANGCVKSDRECPLSERLLQLHGGLQGVIERYRPDEAAVEITLMNKNAASSLKLGLARGVAMLVPAQAGLAVAEYLPNLVKKAVVGTGHADKDQIAVMVRHLLPACEIESSDAADALAVAICHSHHRASNQVWEAAAAPPGRSASRRRAAR